MLPSFGDNIKSDRPLSVLFSKIKVKKIEFSIVFFFK